MSVLKKIFFLSLFVLAVSLLFWGVYNLSFKNNSATTAKKTDADTAQNATPADEVGKITAVSKETVLAPVLSSDKNSIDYLSKKTGQLFQIDFYGNVQKTLSFENISDPLDAAWSVDRSKIIVKTDDAKTPFSFYDLAAKTSAPLKSNLDQVSWQINANRILYKYYDAETKTRTLNVSDPDGKNWTKLSDIPYKNLSVAQIPRTGLISFWNSGDAYLPANFQSMPVVGGDIATLDTKNFGADYLWDNSGQWALVSHTDAKGGTKMELGLMNSRGGEYKNLEIPTFITKCVWSNDGKIVFYALPGGIPDNSVLPNDYKDGKFQTTDTFWKVDIATGKKTRVVEVGSIKGQYDASQLFLNQGESLLFFVNKLDGKIYKLAL
ncbi:MAG: hypothetical protein WC022_01625 [Parcubacteria group bacterium]